MRRFPSRTAAIHSFDRKVSAVIALVLLVETGAAIYATTGWIVRHLSSLP